MINEQRLISLFCDLVSRDNPSFGERPVCDRIKEEIDALGVNAIEDPRGSVTGGNCGNVYSYVDGTKAPPILFCAHMDSVHPATGKKAVVAPDGTITSDGTTVLGSDDLAGVCAILEALRSIKEDRLCHRPLELLFTVAEEVYCAGIKSFDFSKIKSADAYILDLHGDIGTAGVCAPSIISFKAYIMGRAAHAAFAPGIGIHSIKAAAMAVNNVKCGSFDGVSVNIGKIEGGTATNIIPELCTVTGEVRGIPHERAIAALRDVEREFKDAARHFGAVCEFSYDIHVAAYVTGTGTPVCKRFVEACHRAGAKPVFVDTLGGSDNNVLSKNGISGIVVACGMNNVHSCQEYTTVKELYDATCLVRELMLS